MISFDLTSIKFHKAVLISFIVLGNILSPYWFIFNFANKYFHQLDIFRLILLCASVSLPLLLIHTILAYMIHSSVSNNSSPINPNEEMSLGYLAFGTIITIAILLTPSFNSLFRDYALTFRQAGKATWYAALILYMIIVGLSVLLVIIHAIIDHRQRKKDSATKPPNQETTQDQNRS